MIHDNHFKLFRTTYLMLERLKLFFGLMSSSLLNVVPMNHWWFLSYPQLFATVVVKRSWSSPSHWLELARIPENSLYQVGYSGLDANNAKKFQISDQFSCFISVVIRAAASSRRRRWSTSVVRRTTSSARSRCPTSWTRSRAKTVIKETNLPPWRRQWRRSARLWRKWTIAWRRKWRTSTSRHCRCSRRSDQRPALRISTEVPSPGFHLDYVPGFESWSLAIK